MLAAVEMVMRLSKGGERHRDEIAKLVLEIADEADHDANTLAHLTMTAIAEPQRKTA
jgi:hypothetical protein